MFLSKSLLITGILILTTPLTLSAFSVKATTQLHLPKLIYPAQSLLTQAQQKRIALVIGNSHYPGNGELRSPVNDANNIATELRKLGFEVILVMDGDKREMDAALENFTQKLSQGSVGLFYYSGHGASVNGENYLIPIDAHLSSEQDVNYEAFPVGKIQNAMEEAHTDVNIIILDACRANPFEKKWRGKGSTRAIGLSPIQTPAKFYIAFATAPGNTALDGNSKSTNSPFTYYLLQNLKTPGLSIEELFKRVRQGVIKETQSKQVPWDSSSLVGDFSLNPATSNAVAPTETIEVPTPPNAIAYTDFFKRGYDEGNAKNYQAALADYTQAIKLKPDYADAYHNRGTVYENLGNKQAALADYDRAIQLKPDLADAYFNRGIVYKDLGNNQAAIADYDRAIQLKPDLAYAYNNRGIVYKDLGNKQAAIADYDRAIQLKPDLAYAYHNRGIVYYERGDYRAAIADYNRAIQLKPDYADAYYGRGYVYKVLNSKESALSNFKKARDLYQSQGNTEWYNRSLDRINELR